MKLYDFQKEIINKAKNFNCYGFFLDPGCGKTAITIHTILEKVKTFPKTIIFCPKIVQHNWVNEFSLWNPSENSLKVIEGLPPKRIAAIKKNKIIIVNYEAVRTKKVFDALVNFKPNVVICDESHRIKNVTSMQTKRVLIISKDSELRYALTGTPITNTYQDLFTQFLFLDQGDTFGHNFFIFRNRYFVNLNASWNGPKSYPKWEFNKSMESELKDKVNSISISLRKEDCLDLPELVEQKVNIEMSTVQANHYKQIKNDLITWIDGQPENPLVVKNALTKILRLNEIISGYMKLEDKSIERFEDNARLDALMQLLDDLKPHKVIVYCVYRENFKQIGRLLNDETFTELHGAIKDKSANIDRFNDMDNNCRVCLANTQGAIGINLKAAKYAIYYSRNFSLEQYLQSKARNFRAGSIDLHDKITHYNFVTPGTIDESIFLALKHKKKLAYSLADIKNML